ncbi:MAG TPA: FliH/SctL family protein [Opitutaceae bacterium]|nr:FliH/SctL family protein [Opitutaceae bacterium]
MAFAKLVAFDRPLAGAVLPGQKGQLFGEVEVAEKVELAYRRGVDSARAAGDQQMVEFRADMEGLSEGILKQLSHLEPAMLAQLREALPGLALDIARRLLAGFEPPPEIIEKFCREALDQLFPEREGLELALCPRDAAKLNELNPDWLQRYPGLRIRTDNVLGPGDCLVRSRFGLTDGRRQTKLAALEHSLAGA